MPETETMRIYKGDKERIKEMADARGVKGRDVVSDLLREPVFRCPECGEPFDPSEVDPETIREHGLMTTGVDKIVKGQREVKDFECPACEERISPQDIEEMDATEHSGVTPDDLGVTDESEEADFSTEQE